jgi:hypothetical protein
MSGSPLRIMSIIGGSKRAGRWTVPAKTSVIAVFGHSVIDMRLAASEAEEIQITTMSVFASLTILVPEGVKVEPAGTAILASSLCLVPESDRPCELPPIRVEAMTVLGKLRIQTVTDAELGIPKRHWWQRRKAAGAGSAPVTEAAPAPAEVAVESAAPPADEPIEDVAAPVAEGAAEETAEETAAA